MAISSTYYTEDGTSSGENLEELQSFGGKQKVIFQENKVKLNGNKKLSDTRHINISQYKSITSRPNFL